MNDIIQFFKGLFNTSLWPARWHCGTWSDFHGWLYIISDLLIWIAYFMIPVIILNYLAKKKTGLTFQRAYVLFALFILLCGTTHFLDAAMFWIPIYRFNALIRFVTAVVSLLTVYHLIKILPVAFAQKTNIELEKEIAFRKEIEVKLGKANEKLHSANKDLEAFAYIASHDLKEPLRKIQTFSLRLLETKTFDEEGKNFIEKINASAVRLNKMIEEILSLSALPGNINLSFCDTNKAVSQAIKDLEIKISEKNAVIEVSELPAINANETYIVQLFTNLLNNAIKFSRQQPRIHVYGKQLNNRVLLYVQDEGIGMEKEYTGKIFQPFYRLNSKKEYDGFGIGLSICKKIIDIHEGDISVESEPDKGTTFCINMPAARTV